MALTVCQEPPRAQQEDWRPFQVRNEHTGASQEAPVVTGQRDPATSIDRPYIECGMAGRRENEEPRAEGRPSELARSAEPGASEGEPYPLRLL